MRRLDRLDVRRAEGQIVAAAVDVVSMGIVLIERMQLDWAARQLASMGINDEPTIGVDDRMLAMRRGEPLLQRFARRRTARLAAGLHEQFAQFGIVGRMLENLPTAIDGSGHL